MRLSLALFLWHHIFYRISFDFYAIMLLMFCLPLSLLFKVELLLFLSFLPLLKVWFWTFLRYNSLYMRIRMFMNSIHFIGTLFETFIYMRLVQRSWDITANTLSMYSLFLYFTSWVSILYCFVYLKKFSFVKCLFFQSFGISFFIPEVSFSWS